MKILMKKILIAGYPGSTRNYRDAFASLGVPADVLGNYQNAFARLENPAHALPPSKGQSVPPGANILPPSKGQSVPPGANILPPSKEQSVPPGGEDPPVPPDVSVLPSPSMYGGLVLPGGGDVAPALFGAQNRGSRDIDEPLDRIQLALLDAFLRAGKPVLGICKGLQILNVYFGGSIIQDLPEASRRIHEYCEGDRIHPTKAARATFVEKLYGDAPVANSAHHQGIGAVGGGLLVAQYSHDVVVEAMYHKSLPLLGVQWHPERMCFAHANPCTEDGSLLLRYFLSLL